MPFVSNPHKKFQFGIFLFGMNQFLAQKVTLPDREVAQTKHGEGNTTVKTGGMLELGNLVIEKLMTASIPDKLMWSWIRLVQDEFTGGGAPPDVYKKACQVQHLSNNGSGVLATYNYVGVWPTKINGIELDRLSSENTIQSIEFSVDKEAVI